MAADLFIASFLGCLFALVVVTIGAAQIAKWKIRRVIREGSVYLKGQLKQSADGDPQARAELELDRMGIRRPLRRKGAVAFATKASPSGALLPIVRCECGREQAVSLDHDPISDLEAAGWHMDLSRKSQEGSAAVSGWICPACRTSSEMAS